MSRDPRWPSVSSLIPLLLLMGGVACGPALPAGRHTQVRDSAGITIVENTGQVGFDGGGWSAAMEPTLSIGTFQGDSTYQLFQVQGAARLADGRIVVVNSGSGEVRVYDGDGGYLMAHGRKGEGPGEFARPALAGLLPPDTLVVVDNQLRRISLLSPDHGFLASAPMDDDVGGGIYPQGMLGNRTIVLGGGFYFSSDSGEELTNGYTRRQTSYRAAALNGALATDFGAFPGSEFFMQVRQSGGGISMSARLIPFGKYAMAAVSRDRLYFGSGDSWEVRAYGPGGALERLIRLDRSPTPVTDALVESYLRQAESEAADETAAREVRQSLEEMPVPPDLPAFGGLYADAQGFLWVERYRPPGDEALVLDILDPEGRLVGWVTLPPVDEILEISDDHILALHRDELGVEYVKVLSLNRPG